MHEPKYKLNKKDGQRWHALLVRHCLEVGTRRYKKYPPLSAEENAEFERLSRKRDRKHAAHPKAKQAMRRSRYRSRKINAQLAKLEALLKNSVDRNK